MSATRLLPLLLTAAVVAPAELAAPPAAAQPAGERTAMAQLLQLKGRLVNVGYSPGALDRAVRIQERFDGLAERFAAWSGKRVPIAVYLLAREDWERAGLGLPYGFPARMPLEVLALPSWGDAGTVELWHGLLGRSLPALSAQPVRGSPEEAASVAVADTVAEIEGARILLVRAGLLGAETWITELMAHAVADGARRRHEPARLAEVEGIFQSFLASRAGGASPVLAEYRAGISMDQWLWFQARFHEGARLLGGAKGKGAAAPLLKLAKKGGGTLGRAALMRRFPQAADWLARSFGG